MSYAGVALIAAGAGVAGFVLRSVLRLRRGAPPPGVKAYGQHRITIHDAATGADYDFFENESARENRRRPASLGEVVGDVEKALDKVRAGLPAGYAIRVSGQFEAQAEAARLIFLLSFLSLGVMFALLYLHFRSANLVLQTLLNIPTAFAGAVVFVLATGQTVSIATLVGSSASRSSTRCVDPASPRTTRSSWSA